MTYGEYTYRTTHPGMADDGELDDLPLEIELVCTEPYRRGGIWIGQPGTGPEFEILSMRYNNKPLTIAEADTLFGLDVFANMVERAKQAATDSGEFD